MDRRALLTSTAALTATAACSKPTATPGGDGTSPRSTSPGTAAPPSPPPARTPPPSRAAHDWKALATGLDGRLIGPKDADYPTARQLFNTRFDDQRPAAVAYVTGEADVQECLAYARAHRTPVSIRNGGHSYAGTSSGNGRLVIDVSALNRVSSDGALGAGAKLIEVYDALGRTGRTIPAGSCPSVGISGLALGGGHGVASRAYGLTCDSLTAATIVTADGRVLTASAQQEKELFWALRGAGNGNFGVVTAFRFRTRPAPPVVLGYLNWPWSKAAAVLATWQRWGPDQPDAIWSSMRLTAGPGGGRPTCSVSLLSFATEGETQNAVDRLMDDVGSPATSVSLRRRTYHDAMLGYAGCSTFSTRQCHLPGTLPGRTAQGALRRATYTAASDFFHREMPSGGIRTLLIAVERFTRLPAGQGEGSIALTALGGAINRVQPLATAFVHRRSRVLAQYNAAWRAGTPGRAERSWLQQTHGVMRRYASGEAYQNYADPTLANWRRAYYGAAAERLTTLKRRYDPDRLFDFPQAL
ncbi:FAD-binding oxidoreductase [Streptomyces albipurpureus]|uniref:FAD-binding oxidoreductase n=1 Tax=Streptomyces albipurpureus TaxID=2897419 RepID=A0ABT0V330_9ACTN|nr:FAD-binding oxidoreductase [Streptomyces sp. CWNU-1]MCM2394300.1 FAD-binding oxidoreductase [Streptomyces sp. CWNU-1]